MNPLTFSGCPSANSKTDTNLFSYSSDASISFSVSPPYQSQLPCVTQVSYASNVCLPLSSLLFLFFFPIAKASRSVASFSLHIPSSLLLFQPWRFKKLHPICLWSCPWIEYAVEPNDPWRSAPTWFFLWFFHPVPLFFWRFQIFLVYQTL